jgi:membrane peptidoglycan carboxypeptidase
MVLVAGLGLAVSCAMLWALDDLPAKKVIGDDRESSRLLEEAPARGGVVIDAMSRNGAIDAETAKDAKAKSAIPHLSAQALRAGSWFADWVAREATNVNGISGNVPLRTTLIPQLQKLAEEAVANALSGTGASLQVSQAALVAMRPDGAVLAMVGGSDYQASPFNRAVDARRQPGSASELFVYLAALRNGFKLNARIKGWRPENFGELDYDRTTLAEGVVQSTNSAAANLAQQVGLDQVVVAARDLGVTGPLPAVPGLAMGTAEVSLLDLTAAYASVRAGKMPIKPWGIAAIGIADQQPLQSMGPLIATQSMEPDQEPLLKLLQYLMRRDTGQADALDGFAAGKAGTSQNYRDAWFIGFNDTLIVGVWVGNDDGTPMVRVTGGSLPAQIWKRFITEATPVLARDDQSAAAAPPKTAVGAAQTSSGSAPEARRCDYQACARAYQSFRALDCSYQPYDGSSRQFCDKNSPRAQCNIDGCTSVYSSFDPIDCTYRPYGGGSRRMCTK